MREWIAFKAAIRAAASRDRLGQATKGGGARGSYWKTGGLSRPVLRAVVRERKKMFLQKAYAGLSFLRARLERQEGQALVEYALILALIAVVSIAILTALGINVSRVFNSVNTQLSVVPGP